MRRIINHKERIGNKKGSAPNFFVSFAVILVAAFSASAELPQWYLDTGLPALDTDGDGIPDAWERRTFSDPLVADSHLDRDGDGLTDLEEFLLGTDPRTFSTAGDFWSDGEKAAAGLDPLARVESAVGIEQWLAYLGWDPRLWFGWDAQAWLALHAPDENGFGRPYSWDVYNTPPYSGTNRTGTVDFWLKTRTDRLAWATVSDPLSTSHFLVLPGERSYRIRAAKGGAVSLTVDPLPGTFAEIPGATNGLWLCELSLEPAQPKLLIFPAGFPPLVPDPPFGLECLVVGDEPEEEGAPPPPAGGMPPGPFRPLADPPPRIDAVHESVSVGGDYGGVWCLCSELPTFGSLSIGVSGGATLNGEAISPHTPLFDQGAAAALLSEGQEGGVLTQSVESVKYSFMREAVPILFGTCNGHARDICGAESNAGLVGDFIPHAPHRPPPGAVGPVCFWRNCECAAPPTTYIGFAHYWVNTRNLDHDDEPEDDKKIQHCLGIKWSGNKFDLTDICESFGYDLAEYVKWEVDGKLQDSPELDLKKNPSDLTPTIFRIKMVDKGNAKSVWDRIILVVNNESTKTRFDSWYKRFSAEKGWLAELPAMYNRLAVTTNWLGTIGLNGDPEPSTTNLWASPSGLGAFIHHTAKWEMRSRETVGGHGHQACYDTNGVIILSGVSAGTADFGCAVGYNSVHITQDVDPFIRALQLDGNPCLRSTWNLTHALIFEGDNIAKYQVCRPAVPNKKPRLAPGAVP